MLHNRQSKRLLTALLTVSALCLSSFCIVADAEAGTKYIPSDTSIGTWDSVNRIFTLTTDVADTIEIEDSNLTLDGAGHTVSGPGDGYGVFLYGLTGVTVENVTVDGFVYGILVNTTSYSTISCNVTSNNDYGIRLGPTSPWNVVTGNTVSSSTTYGISLYKSGRTVVSENTMSNNAYGMRINQANNGDINNNNFIDNTVQATIASATGNVFNQNYWSDWSGSGPYVFTGGQDDQPLSEEVASPCNEAPVADADGPYVVLASTWEGADVQLDGTGSSDSEGTLAEYNWDLDLQHDSDFDGDPTNDVDATGATVISNFPVAVRDISLVVIDDDGAASEADVTTVTVSIETVGMDIKPGSYPNVINLGSNGVIPLAFLTDEDFDALTIYPDTITLRGEDCNDGLVKVRGKKGQPMATPEDVDDDGDLDLLVHLDTERLADYELDAEVEIGGLTQEGIVVSGTDTVHIVPE
ncbi:MAG: NosD domain-containing protein [Planctomycetota bacterium]|jgi:parallel beta-helix repeat protein